ncbi:MAG: nucleotidyl transferase AbiEii/AbiGii toxin family protein [Deltaproteobacteria bacterium]|nr:nucleotidyl transferase AbiEii/AbiGii toxin family protein [Deltaproteobacteria bacterium]
MSVRILQERLESYQCSTWQEEEHSLKEILQEIALAGLSRTDFFKQAAFQGGTALRIFYSLQRFSEDLDFLLRRSDSSFQLAPYLHALQEEFQTYGITITVQDRSKADENVRKAFLKEDSIGKVLTLKHFPTDRKPKSLRVKLEVDSNPPQAGGFETKYLDFPFPFPVTLQDLPSLFAGKSHALLCREYVKGRDWYDFVWYVSRKTPINFEFLTNACRQVGHWEGIQLIADKEWYLKEMKEKIKSIDWQTAKNDVARFLKAPELKTIEVWGRDFFLDRLQKMREYL